jgi:putative membrane protein
MRLFISWLIIAISLFVAVWLVPGIDVQGTNAWLAVGLTAVILGLVNIFIKPLLTFLSCGFIVLTLGLFMIVINALMLWLASWIANLLGIGFIVDGFWSALLGSIIISIVSFVLSMFFQPDKEKA